MDIFKDAVRKADISTEANYTRSQMRSSEYKGPVLEAVDPSGYSGASGGRECHEAKERGSDQIATYGRLF